MLRRVGFASRNRSIGRSHIFVGPEVLGDHDLKVRDIPIYAVLLFGCICLGHLVASDDGIDEVNRVTHRCVVLSDLLGGDFVRHVFTPFCQTVPLSVVDMPEAEPPI
jgi:hypothetical protein